MNRNKQNGAVLMMMMIFLIMITLLSLSMMDTATIQVKMAKNHEDGVTAFQAAESGLAESRGRLANQATALAIVNDLLDPLAGNEFTFCNGAGFGTTGVTCPDDALGDSRYDATLNRYRLYTPNGSPAPTMRVLDILSVGTTTTQARRTVFSHAVAPFMDINPGAALSLYDAGNVNMNGNPLVTGNDTSVPANPNCNGSGCAGSDNPFGTDVVGLYSENATDQIMNGIPVIAGSPAEQVGGSPLDSAYWADWANTSGHLADSRNGVGGWGTRANPIVHVVDGDLAVMGGLDSFGVLIVSGANLTIGGTFHHEGIILVLADTSAASVTMGGTSRIFGSLVIVGTNADINYTGGGTPEIMYSSEALNQMSQNQSWSTRGWASY